LLSPAALQKIHSSNYNGPVLFWFYDTAEIIP
jgi:hypothetical protein